MGYDHRSIEAKWQKRWQDERVFSAPTPSSVQDPSPRDLPARSAGALLSKGGQARRGVAEDRGEVYVLDMFPYPSGDGLHVGHPIGYIGTDIFSRYQRMNGKNVLHPMGWDAFGLPAENYAIKKGIHPSEVTDKNIKNIKRQMQMLAFSYDWDREVNTTDPKYYKWTQWIFLQLFKKGLAYEAELPIWWCPKDKTGLANEEVVGGVCDRCGTKVERKMLRQWVLKITDYAERLLSGLDKLDWPESIKALQRNWIGRSEGAEVVFGIEGHGASGMGIRVFTTRPDTLFGATYLVLSPEHPLVDKITITQHKSAVEKYKKEVASKSDLERTALEKEKTGVFTGAYAINPVNNEKIPVWIADYVLASYGTGAIMAVPAHDERDFAFAEKFKLPIIEVIEPRYDVLGDPRVELVKCWTGEGTLMNSGKFDDLPSEDGRKKIVAWLEKKGKARFKVQYKLRDWIFSRQRYWGEPIPLVHCETCQQKVEATPHYLNFISETTWHNLLSGKKTIETRALNPDEPDRYFGNIEPGHARPENYIKGIFKPTGETAYFRVKGVITYKSLPELFADKKALAAVAPDKKFKNLKELETSYDQLAPGYADKIAKNGLIAFEVRHVLPGIIIAKDEELPVLLPDIEKYEPTGTGESPLAAVKDWVNVTCRVCGHPATRETNTMPQWAGSCWYYIRFTDPDNESAMASPEAMKAWLPIDLYVGGAEHAVLHLMYARFWHMVLYDVGAIPKEVGDEPFTNLKNQGLILGPDGDKMSKSRGNVVNPDDIVEEYGADTLRMYEMFMGPFEDAKPWDTHGIAGVRRFLDKVWRAGERLSNVEPNIRWHKYVKSITEGIKDFRFNTGISDLMKWVNEWGVGDRGIGRGEFEVFLKVLSPYAPHIAEELWAELGHKKMLAEETWPKFDPKRVQEKTVTIAVQVMGKLRATMTIPAGSDKTTVEAAAKAEANVAKYLTNKPKKVIFVKDRLINFVV